MRRQIQKCIEDEINPFVANHGGSIALVDYLDKNVYIQMSGGCQGCAASTATLKQGITRILRENFPEDINEIIDVTDHEAGNDPYYSEGGASPYA
ncbi:MAG: NifU family protein [Myxococcota bacterium]